MSKVNLRDPGLLGIHMLEILSILSWQFTGLLGHAGVLWKKIAEVQVAMLDRIKSLQLEECLTQNRPMLETVYFLKRLLTNDDLDDSKRGPSKVN